MKPTKSSSQMTPPVMAPITMVVSVVQEVAVAKLGRESPSQLQTKASRHSESLVSFELHQVVVAVRRHKQQFSHHNPVVEGPINFSASVVSLSLTQKVFSAVVVAPSVSSNMEERLR